MENKRLRRTLTNDQMFWDEEKLDMKSEPIPPLLCDDGGGVRLPSSADVSFQQILQMANVNEPNVELCLDLLREKIVLDGLPKETLKHKNSVLLGKYKEKCEACTLQFMIEKCDYEKVIQCEEKLRKAYSEKEHSEETLKFLQNDLLDAIKNFETKRFMYEDEWDEESEMDYSDCIECKKTFRENSIRRKVWLALLRIKLVDLDHYITLVAQGSQAEDYGSLLKDIDRTIGYFPHLVSGKITKKRQKLLKEELFKKMKRIINSFLLTHGDRYSFIQGMTVFCSLLLLHMSEIEAYYCFDRLCTKVFPTYINPKNRSLQNASVNGMEGVYAACNLVDKLIQIDDPELFKLFQQNKVTARFWAFKYISVFMCSVMDIQIATVYWDFFLSTGFHMVVLCVYAAVKLKRNELLRMRGKQDNYIQNDVIPNANPHEVVSEVCKLMENVPPRFYNDLVNHLHDVDLCVKICSSPVIDSKQ